MGRGPLLLASSLIVALCGCGTASDVATDALSVVDPTVSAAHSYVESAGTLLVALTAMPEGQSRSQNNTLERQRAAMAQRAGPSKFRNPQLVRARENLQMRDPTIRNGDFQARADRFHNFEMQKLKNALNRGQEREMPVEGSLKAALGLEAALNLGLAPVLNHPVLGELLPRFSTMVID